MDVVPWSRELCCKFFVETLKMIPLLFTLYLLSWSYYAYVFYAYSECVVHRRRRACATRGDRVPFFLFFISRSRRHVARSQSGVSARVPRYTRFTPVVLLHDGFYRAGRSTAWSKRHRSGRPFTSRLLCRVGRFYRHAFFSKVQTADRSVRGTRKASY